MYRFLKKSRYEKQIICHKRISQEIRTNSNLIKDNRKK